MCDLFPQDRTQIALILLALIVGFGTITVSFKPLSIKISEEKKMSDKEKDDLLRSQKIWRLLVWWSLGILSIFFVFTMNEGPLYGDFHKEANLTAFFTRNQLILLAIIVALAAYISNVKQKLHEVLGTNSLEISEKVRHWKDLAWLESSDASLVFLLAALLIRIIFWAFGHRDEMLDKGVMALLAWAILYLISLHIRQHMIKASPFKKSSHLNHHTPGNEPKSPNLEEPAPQ